MASRLPVAFAIASDSPPILVHSCPFAGTTFAFALVILTGRQIWRIQLTTHRAVTFATLRLPGNAHRYYYKHISYINIFHWREPVFKFKKHQTKSVPKVKVKQKSNQQFQKSNKVNFVFLMLTRF